MDSDLQRLADAAEGLERQAGELREQVAELAEAVRKRAEAEAEQSAGADEQANGSDAGTDDSEVRLVAYSMVLDGKPRDEVASHLETELGLSDSEALLDDLYARANE
jgi:septal ring factor EnvC (AmiA/AmiB activator)